MRSVLPLAAVIGIHMALWVYAEAHIAAGLGVGRGSGIVAGLLVSVWLWLRLQSMLRIARKVKSVPGKRGIFILSPIFLYVFFKIFIGTNSIIIMIIMFLLLTIYLGVLLAIASSKIYSEIPTEAWGHAVSLFRSATILFQVIVLSILSIYDDRIAEGVGVIVAVMLPLALLSAREIQGSIISSITLRKFDLLSDLLIEGRTRTVTTGNLIRMSALLGGLAVTKMTLLPKAVGDNPFEALALYALAYLIGTRVASVYYTSSMLTIVFTLATFISVFLLGSPLYSLLLAGFAMGFVEVSITLLVLMYRPGIVQKANQIVTSWIVIGSIVVGVVSKGLPEYSALAGIIVALMGFIVSRRV